jgi:hypothetical protein
MARAHVTLFFTFEGGGAGRSRVSFVKPEDVPPFEGESAWFVIDRVSAKPRAYWRAMERVTPPGR